MKKENVVRAFTALIILLFAYTSTSKLLDHHRFVFQMSLSPLPAMKLAAPFLGYLVPAAELGLVLMLLSNKYRYKGFWYSLMLLLFFEAYIIAMLLSGLDLPCTCGGIINSLSWQQHVIFNAIFIGIAIFNITYYRARPAHISPAVGKKIFHAHEQQGNRYL